MRKLLPAILAGILAGGVVFSVSAPLAGSARPHFALLRNVGRFTQFLRHVVASHPVLQTATFVRGNVITRTATAMMVREADGRIVQVAMPAIRSTIVAFAPGAPIVLPVQIVNDAYRMVPVFTQVADKNELAMMPAGAKCSENDNDADDAFVDGKLAPSGACLYDDGDADDATNGSGAQTASGYVVSANGSIVELMTPSLTPLSVDLTHAGAVHGDLTPGRFVTIEDYRAP